MDLLTVTKFARAVFASLLVTFVFDAWSLSAYAWKKQDPLLLRAG